jgi:hypothetical protein
MFKRGLVSTILILILACYTNAATDQYIQARIYIDSEDEFVRLLALHPDIAYQTENSVDIITNDEELGQINMLGFKYDIIYEDVVAFLQSRLDPAKDMGGYKTLDEIYNYIDGIIADHPDITMRVDIGHSLEDRPIYAIKISDNPEIDEDEAEVLYTGAIHAREVATPEVSFYTMDHLTDNYGSDPNVTFLVDNRELWFIPVINVDGYYRNEIIAPNGGGMWRKNMRNNGDGTWGVDLNRNFSYMWGYDDFGSSSYGGDETYRGTGPFSEPTMQNIRDFTIAHNFVISIYYHQFGGYYTWPYNYLYGETPDEPFFSAMVDSMRAHNYYGRRNVNPGGGGPNGMSTDWNYGEQTTKNKNFSFLPEIGYGSDNFWPSLERLPVIVAEHLIPNLLIAEFAAEPYSILPPASPEIVLDELVDATEYEVHWTHDDPDNPGLMYELREGLNFELTTNPGEDMYGLLNEDFSVTEVRAYNGTTSFFSGSENYVFRYIQTIYPYEVLANDSAIFWAWYDLEDDYDFFFMEVSTNGEDFIPIKGNISWQVNTWGYNRNNVGTSGASDGWERAAYDLSNYLGQQVFFRISYYTSPGGLSEGVYIDDFYPMNGFEIEGVVSSEITDDFYTFYDKPDGNYSYVVRAVDAQGQWSGYSDLKTTRVLGPFLCGDTDGDDVFDLLDIVFMIDHKFKDGPAPEPPEAADTNSDGAVDLLDIVVMIDNKFKDGPEPDCPL